MLTIIKNSKNSKNKIFLKSFFCNVNFFFIDKIFNIPLNIKINKKKKILYFNSLLWNLKYSYSKNIFFFIIYNKLLLNIIIKENKKKYLNLYNRIIKIKIKGILQGFKIILIIKGLGFKFNINDKKLILKLGFSHNIIINIPDKIKIIKQNDRIIFSSIDYIFLKQFIYYLRSFKKLDIYKEKGLLIQGEKIYRKEGKKNKK